MIYCHKWSGVDNIINYKELNVGRWNLNSHWRAGTVQRWNSTSLKELPDSSISSLIGLPWHWQFFSCLLVQFLICYKLFINSILHIIFINDCDVQLGCGAGLPGLFALLNGAAKVHFQDYVSENSIYYSLLLLKPSPSYHYSEIMNYNFFHSEIKLVDHFFHV